MNYFVTGATGFIGRHLVEELLKRDGTIYVLVREGSRGKVDALVAAPRRRRGPDRRRCPATCPSRRSASRASTRRSTTSSTSPPSTTSRPTRRPAERANVEGTRHVVEFANSHDVGRFHHTSSIAVAGDYKGVFQEDMFDEGQKLPHDYHRTKYESEKLVRDGRRGARRWSTARGSSSATRETGEMDKIDGPYYFFKLLQRLRHALPEWFPLAGPEGGKTNIVPVDFVAQAMDHIAHLPDDDLPGDTFHLVDPEPMTVGETLNAFAKAAHAPQFAMRVDANLTNAVPKPVRAGREGAAHGQEDPQPDLQRPRHPAGGDGEPRLPLHLRRARHPARARAAPASRCRRSTPTPAELWDYWERNLDPDLFRDRSLATAIEGKRIADHRRLVGHRPRDRAAGSARPAAR